VPVSRGFGIGVGCAGAKPIPQHRALGHLPEEPVLLDEAGDREVPAALAGPVSNGPAEWRYGFTSPDCDHVGTLLFLHS